MNHTPNPWLADVDGGLMVENDDPDQPPCELGKLHFPADAAHIVRCVNAHDELVAALEAIDFAYQIPNAKGEMDDRDCMDRMHAIARAALAKVQS
jgi:hypothetical protein